MLLSTRPKVPSIPGCPEEISLTPDVSPPPVSRGAPAGHDPRRAVVLGAGLAGLRSALYLLDHGYEAELLEKLSEPGGMARSHEVDGFVFDHGPHGFFSRDDWIVQEFKDLLGEDGYRWRTKWSRIHYRGEYFSYPLKLADLARKMDFRTLVAGALSFLWSRLRVNVTRRRARNTEEYLIDQFGRVIYDEFFGPYTRKVWDVDPRELDADFARDRLPTLNLWDVARKLFTDPEREQMRETPSGRVPTHDLHVFYYPKKGARQLPRAYADRVREHGGRFRFDTDVERVEWKNRTVHGRSGGEPFVAPYDALVSTIPLDVLTELMEPAPPARIRQLAQSLRYRGIILANLCVDKEEVIPCYWIYYTDRLFNRISEYRHFSPDLVPEGQTGICLELGCNESEELWNADDGEIVRRCLPDLEELDLVSRDEILGHQVIREPNAYPIYDVGYRERINELVEWLEGRAHIMTAGRQGRFLYINQDAAIKSGYEAGAAATELVETGQAPTRRVWDDRPRRKVVV